MNELAAEGVFGAENQVVELLTGELVANAVLHGPSDGVVRVRAWRAGDTVRVRPGVRGITAGGITEGGRHGRRFGHD